MTGPGDRGLDLRTGLVVALAALVAYATALAGTFVYDDVHSVASNQGVQTLGNAFRFFVDPTLFSSAGGVMYRPVLLLSFAIDSAIGGTSPLQFKLTNVLLHAASAMLLFGLARRHAVCVRAAAAGALLFAVHPLASEAINFVSARSEGLLLFGLLLALFAHTRVRLGQRWWLFGLCGGAVVACGSKETGVMLPVLLLVQEWALRHEPGARASMVAVLRDWRARAVDVLPVVVLVLVYLAARRALLGQATVTLVGRSGSDPLVGHSRDLITQLATMGLLLPKAMLQMVVPVGLTIDSPVSYQRSFWSLPVLLGWAGVFAATWLGCHRGRQRPLRLLGTAMAWCTALPWILVPLNTPMAEHRLYGPLAGVCLVAACAIDGANARRSSGVGAGVGTGLSTGVDVARPAWRPRPLAVGITVLLLFALQSARRSLEYRDESGLWRSALALNPRSSRAHWGLGGQAQLAGDFATAQRCFARACALSPGFLPARRAWVESMLALPAEQGWPFRAVVVAEELTRQKDDDPYCRLLHANAMLQVGIARDDRDTILAAEARVLSCLQIGEPKALVYRLAAECRRRIGDLPGALRHFDEALLAGLDFPSLRAERSVTLRDLGRTAEADRELRRAFRQAPMDTAVRAAMQRAQAAPPK